MQVIVVESRYQRFAAQVDYFCTGFLVWCRTLRAPHVSDTVLSDDHRIRFRKRLVKGDNVAVFKRYAGHDEFCSVQGLQSEIILRDYVGH